MLKCSETAKHMKWERWRQLYLVTVVAGGWQHKGHVTFMLSRPYWSRRRHKSVRNNATLSPETCLQYDTERNRHFSDCHPVNCPSSPSNTWQPSAATSSSRLNSYSSRFATQTALVPILARSRTCQFMQQSERNKFALPTNPPSFNQYSECWRLGKSVSLPAMPPCQPSPLSTFLILEFTVYTPP